MTAAMPGYGAHLPDELLLGHIAWFTVKQPRKTHQELAELVADLKLSPAIIPNPPRLGDAFKRACRYSERKNLPIPLSNHMANFLIRPVTQTIDEIERHLIMEIVDAEGRVLEYKNAAKLVFNRNKGILSVSARVMPPELDPMLKETLNRFNANFDEATKFIDAQIIRRMIREQLAEMRAILIRREGTVWFTPISERKNVEALEEFCNQLGGGSAFHSVPLPDTTKQRELVKVAFEEEVHEEATQLITEFRAIQNAGDKITARHWQGLRERFNSMKDNFSEYGGMIDNEMAKAKIEIEAVERQLTDFISEGLIKT